MAEQLRVDVDKLIQQTRRYEFADGLRDLQLSVSLVLGGLMCWLVFEPAWMAFLFNLAKDLGRWVAWVSLLLVFLPGLAAWGLLGLMSYVRRRWLWSEGGMVKPSRRVVPRRVQVLSAAIIIGSISLGFGLRQLGWADDQFVLRMIWASAGWSFGYTLIALGRNLSLTRYVRLGMMGGLASTIILSLPLTFGQGALVFGIGWGLALALSGIVVLRHAVLSMRKVKQGG